MKNLIKVVGLMAVGLVGGGAISMAGVTGVVPVPFGPAAAIRAEAEKEKPPVTVMYPVRERVANLADRTTPRYLKTQVVLEFIDTKTKEPPKGEEVKKQQEEFVKEMAAYAPIIEDEVGSVLSSKTSVELLRPNGREALKAELINRLNHALHEEERVVNVYFPSFIVQ
jgi:flagellar FliL protein